MGGAASTTDWLVRLDRASAPSKRVICFPNAGGSATAFRVWLPELSSDLELLGVQFPGRQKRIREAPLRDFHKAVDAMLPCLAPFLDPSTVLFGDCMGALVAYGVIRAAKAAGLPPPGHLLVSCCRAPNLPCRYGPLHGLDDEALVEQIRRLAFAPEWLLRDTVTFRSFLPLLRCDFELAESYVYQPAEPLSVPITAIAATQDKITPEADVQAWQHFTSAGFEYVRIDSSHDVVLTHGRDIVQLVRARAGGGTR